MNIFSFSHQIMQLKLLANHNKDQVIFMHFGLLFLRENACEIIWWRLDKDPYCNCTNVIWNELWETF